MAIDGGLGLGVVMLLAAVLGPAPEAPTAPCFDASGLETRSGEAVRVRPAEIKAVRAALAAASGYRACISYASLFHGYARATFEFSKPDRVRWTMRRRPHGGEPSTVEMVRIGADTWYRTGEAWQRLAPGQTLAQALPRTWTPTDPASLVDGITDDKPSLWRVGETTARAGRAALWENRGEPEGISSVLAIGLTDRLPYRYYGGGPSVEAYLQVDFYDFGAAIDIVPPR